MNCKECFADLPIDAKSNRKFCDKHCASEYAKKEWRERNPKSPLTQLATNTVAEANEMKVAIDLLVKGWQVYRAAFPGMLCDMLIYSPNAVRYEEDSGMRRVEVTSGNYAANGTLSHPIRTPANYDVLAIVTPSKIVYKPELGE